MAKRELRVGPSLARIEVLKVEYRAREREVNQLEHKARKEKTVGRSTILGDCEPDCAACAESRELWDLGQQIRAVEIKLNAENARRAINAAPRRGKLGGDAKRARSFSGVIDAELERRANAGVRNMDWDRIQTVLRSQAVVEIQNGRWPAASLVKEDFRAEVQNAIAAAKARPGYPVKVETKWLKLPSESAIEKRRAKFRRERRNKISKT